MSFRPYLLFVGLLFAASGSASAHAATLNVPGDFPTIQSAIEAAIDGDEVEVAAGTYVENVDFQSKSIVVRSTSGAAATIIDGSAQTLGAQRSSTVILNEESGISPTLDGFTVTGGTGTAVGSFGVLHGGGVLIRNGGGQIIDCIIEENVALRGAGVASVETGNALVVEGTIFRHNRSLSGDGGGLLAYGAGTLQIAQCEFSFNQSGLGAGVYAITREVTIEGTVFRENTLSDDGGVTYGAAVVIGPVSALTPQIVEHSRISDCQFLENSAGFGGGAVLTLRTSLTCERTTFRGNSAGTGSAILTDTCALEFSYCLFHRNVAGPAGEVITPGINGSQVTLDHCTIVDNICDGGIMYQGFPGTSFPSLTVSNCIVQGNSNGTWLIAPEARPEYLYSNLQDFDLSTGLGLIDENPLFVDPANEDYRLLPGSPCIDAGDPAFALDPDGTNTDLGAFPFALIGGNFVRGDSNQDGLIDMSDAVRILDVAILGKGLFQCDAAADSNSDDRVDMGDAIFVFCYVFSMGAAPSAPFPDCGDAARGLSCLNPAGCP